MIRGATLVFVGLALLTGCGGNDEAATTTTVTETTTATTTTTEGETTVAGPAVARLQAVMTRLGYYTGDVDGVYGEETTAAVTAMQEDLGVTADGIYGPETHVALVATGRATAQAKRIVATIQTTLTQYGYYTGPIDGVYGEETTAAVKELQTDLGVTADGRVGPETIEAFNQAVANGELQPVSG
jgi:peptidoglycan hydrolase-like protein with peptidoglycan-binding domain